MKNFLAVVAGLIIGSIINMGLIMIGSEVILPPEGVDVSDMESIAASMHLFQPQHFISPFVAHAAGTLVGALVAAKIAFSHQFAIGLSIGAFFLLGGIASAYMLPAPIWFIALDLIAAYLPMAWIGVKLSNNSNES